jgi:hypothetical protein
MHLIYVSGEESKMRHLILLFIMFTVAMGPMDLEAKRRRGRRRGKRSKITTKYKYKKNTDVEFDEVELDGAFQKPEGYYSLKAKKNSFDDMISPKKNFNNELKNSVSTEQTAEAW